MASAIIPEMATLITAGIVTVALVYFASFRKSLVILVLGMLGAYLTPFVIGQNGVWASNMSFNAYLIYFAMVNGIILFLGKSLIKEHFLYISVANFGGLFVGTFMIYALMYNNYIIDSSNYWTSIDLSVIIMTIIVILSLYALVQSSQTNTEEHHDTFLSIGYLVPLGWFLSQLHIMLPAHTGIKIVSYVAIAVAYFLCWYLLRPLKHSRYQHIGAYVGGIIALVFAVSNAFGDTFNLYSSTAVVYIGLILACLNYIITAKGERVLSAIILTIFGSIFALFYLYTSGEYTQLERIAWAIGILFPASVLYFIGKTQSSTPEVAKQYLFKHSFVAWIVVIAIIIFELAESINFEFLLFVLPGFITTIAALFYPKDSKDRLQLVKIGSLFVSIGFFGSFFYFVAKLVPHIADNDYLFRNGGILQNWNFLKAVLAIATYAIALHVLRAPQYDKKEHGMIFFTSTILYASLLLVVNFIIIVAANEANVAQTTGGIRAILTTIWWILLSIFLLILGIRKGSVYSNEKMLGLILLGLTIGKIALYDLATMEMNKKIIVLMIVGGALMLFSYFLQKKGYLSSKNASQEKESE